MQAASLENRKVMRQSNLSPARPIEVRMRILTIARELWFQAGQQRGRLKDFWEIAEQRFAAGDHASANHFCTNETSLTGRTTAD